MPFGRLSSGKVASRCCVPSDKIRQTPRLAGSQATTETYRAPWLSRVMPVTALKKGPQKVSGCPIGSRA
jgi:hypothetical protein